ncbi:NAD(P)-dependent dehydrogenase (short-subunit alcohol dehydrogenase family) [Antricoccus suffuscus]|uniref:NAD(P)-dependent dehydrogenase (Short-subunit alcohol dehydrogenase family) n=1 Tax=Antricoccus suffuscus TaxID=1629062 RepID=A0A2T1A062_9ACTN|nr:SDR family oxidoreductase [Antricoccus suffuscus]PRZ41993.1 NAD(P)-dependent dehydrogenase (short-subunit alcohol dehydrogenase family) [Antricoccus suffuscus]
MNSVESVPVTIITGGSRGIGAAIARKLAKAGHNIVITYQSNTVAAAEVSNDVRKAGQECLALQADMAVEADIVAAFEAAKKQFGRVTGLVNNAGITGWLGKITDQKSEDIQAVFDVNCVGLFLCCKYAAREMSISLGGNGGNIVNISSGAATIGGPNEYVHYAASKAAVDAATVGLSKELGQEGIRVNAVAPGAVYTDIHAAGGQPDKAERVGSGTPLGRAGQPEEIANAVAWLMSDEASYTTGAVLRVAGGR